MTKRERATAFYYERKSKGLCTDCGKPTEDGMVICRECRQKRSQRRMENSEKLNAYRREHTAKKKAEGLCIYCGTRKAREGKVACEECGKKQAEKAKETRKRLHEMGLCECGEKLIGQEKTCPVCKARKADATAKWLERMNDEQYEQHLQNMRANGKARRDRWREEHRCITCGHKIPDEDTHKTCPLCREKARNKAHLRYKPVKKEFGICARCDKRVYKNSKLCKEHYDIACAQAEYARQYNHSWKEANELLFERKE